MGHLPFLSDAGYGPCMSSLRSWRSWKEVEIPIVQAKRLGREQGKTACRKTMALSTLMRFPLKTPIFPPFFENAYVIVQLMLAWESKINN